MNFGLRDCSLLLSLSLTLLCHNTYGAWIADSYGIGFRNDASHAKIKRITGTSYAIHRSLHIAVEIDCDTSSNATLLMAHLLENNIPIEQISRIPNLPLFERLLGYSYTIQISILPGQRELIDKVIGELNHFEEFDPPEFIDEIKASTHLKLTRAIERVIREQEGPVSDWMPSRYPQWVEEPDANEWSWSATTHSNRIVNSNPLRRLRAIGFFSGNSLLRISILTSNRTALLELRDFLIETGISCEIPNVDGDAGEKCIVSIPRSYLNYPFFERIRNLFTRIEIFEKVQPADLFYEFLHKITSYLIESDATFYPSLFRGIDPSERFMSEHAEALAQNRQPISMLSRNERNAAQDREPIQGSDPRSDYWAVYDRSQIARRYRTEETPAERYDRIVGFRPDFRPQRAWTGEEQVRSRPVYNVGNLTFSAGDVMALLSLFHENRPVERPSERPDQLRPILESFRQNPRDWLRHPTPNLSLYSIRPAQNSSADSAIEGEDFNSGRLVSELVNNAVRISQDRKRAREDVEKGESKVGQALSKIGVTDFNCPVCLEDFKEGDEIVALPCKHGFHTECFQRWYFEHSTCPECRREISEGQTLPKKVVLE